METTEIEDEQKVETIKKVKSWFSARIKRLIQVKLSKNIQEIQINIKKKNSEMIRKHYE